MSSEAVKKCDCPIKEHFPEDRERLVMDFPQLTRSQRKKNLAFLRFLADENALRAKMTAAQRKEHAAQNEHTEYWFGEDDDTPIPEMVRHPQDTDT
jgi:hypothetical protein